MSAPALQLCFVVARFATCSASFSLIYKNDPASQERTLLDCWLICLVPLKLSKRFTVVVLPVEAVHSSSEFTKGIRKGQVSCEGGRSWSLCHAVLGATSTYNSV